MPAGNTGTAATAAKKQRDSRMKICVTSTGNNQDAQVDPRFGRCAFFLFTKPEGMQFEALENPNLNFSGGAGIQSAQLMIAKGVQAVLTGNIGPNAHRVLSAAGIKVYTGVSGTIKDAIGKYKLGQLKQAEAPNVGSKFGMQNK